MGKIKANESLIEEVVEVLAECEENYTLDPASLRCRRCSACGPNEHKRKACDGRRDTECECNRDYYSDEGDVLEVNSCQPCDLCPHGWGAHQPCKKNRNSVCRRCSPGSYSSVLSSTLACFPCTTCHRHQTLVHNCTSLHDTVCLDVERQSKQSPKALTPFPQHLDFLSSSSASGDDHHSVWPIYCALLLTLLLASVVYFLLKRWKMSAGIINQNNQLIVNGGGRRLPPPTIVPALSGGSQQLLYRDICRYKRRLLENMLHERETGSGNWKDLAVMLGYSGERVMEFESKCDHQLSASRRLLNDWASQRNYNATWCALEVALHAIGRRDIAQRLNIGNSQRCICAEQTLCNCYLQVKPNRNFIQML